MKKVLVILCLLFVLFFYGCTSEECNHPEMRTGEFRISNNNVEVYCDGDEGSRTAFFYERLYWKGCSPSSTYTANMKMGGTNWFLDVMCAYPDEIIIKIGYIYPEGYKDQETFDGIIVVTEIKTK